MSQVPSLNNLRFIDSSTRPSDLPLEYHVNKARNNKAAMNSLIAVESLQIRYEMASSFEKQRMHMFQHVKYVTNVDHGGWFVDRSDPEHPVSLKFTEDIQDALRLEARNIARQNAINSEAEHRIRESKQKDEDEKKKNDFEKAVQERLHQVRITTREEELKSLFPR